MTRSVSLDPRRNPGVGGEGKVDTDAQSWTGYASREESKIVKGDKP
jgi:hypothetical protein